MLKNICKITQSSKQFHGRTIIAPLSHAKFTEDHHQAPVATGAAVVEKQQRSFLTFSTITNKTRQYVKKELVGYSMEQMYEVVSDVSHYYEFVPYVKKSHVHSKSIDFFKADLIVGFPPLNEVYTSDVTLNRPQLVRAVCKDGRLFNFLLNEWIFSAGLKDIPQSCVIDFKVLFEFKSLIHSNIANLFFDFICDQMEHAFITEANRRFGAPSVRSHILKSHRS